MRKLLALCFVCVSSPAAADGYGFRTPSGNIYCNGAVLDSFIDCSIVDVSTYSVPRPTDCTGVWGHTFSMNRDGSAEISCSSKRPGPVNYSSVLQYGETADLGGISCVSDQSGLTCTNQSGHGFTLARRSQTLIDPAATQARWYAEEGQGLRSASVEANGSAMSVTCVLTAAHASSSVDVSLNGTRPDGSVTFAFDNGVQLSVPMVKGTFDVTDDQTERYFVELLRVIKSASAVRVADVSGNAMQFSLRGSSRAIGACPPVRATPANSPQSSAQPADPGSLVLKLETYLRELGFPPGLVDGVVDAETNAAISAYQTDRGLPVTGGMTLEDFQALEAEALALSSPQSAAFPMHYELASCNGLPGQAIFHYFAGGEWIRLDFSDTCLTEDGQLQSMEPVSDLVLASQSDGISVYENVATGSTRRVDVARISETQPDVARLGVSRGPEKPLNWNASEYWAEGYSYSNSPFINDGRSPSITAYASLSMIASTVQNDLPAVFFSGEVAFQNGRASVSFKDEQGLVRDANFDATYDLEPSGEVTGVGTLTFTTGRLAGAEGPNYQTVSISDITFRGHLLGQDGSALVILGIGKGSYTAHDGSRHALMASLSVQGETAPAEQVRQAPSDNPILNLETYLDWLGFPPGTIDGVVDDATYAAIRAYQTARGLPVTGGIDQAGFERLEEEALLATFVAPPAIDEPPVSTALVATSPIPGDPFVDNRIEVCEGTAGFGLLTYGTLSEDIHLTDMCIEEDAGTVLAGESVTSLTLAKEIDGARSYEDLSSGADEYQRNRIRFTADEYTGGCTEGTQSIEYVVLDGAIQRPGFDFAMTKGYTTSETFPLSGPKQSEMLLGIRDASVPDIFGDTFGTLIISETGGQYTVGKGSGYQFGEATGGLTFDLSEDGTFIASGSLAVKSARLAGHAPHEMTSLEGQIPYMRGHVLGKGSQMMLAYGLFVGTYQDASGQTHDLRASTYLISCLDPQ